MNVLDWIQNTQYAVWVRESWGWPFALTLHAFGNAMVVGLIVLHQVPGSAGIASLHAGGAAMRGGTLGITIDSGLPNGAGLLVLSLTDGNSVLKTCPYLTGAPLLFLPVTLGGGGSGKLSGTVPDLPSSVDIYMQYFGFDASAPNGAFYSTNGLLLPIFDY
jgi:hypothetical protein